MLPLSRATTSPLSLQDAHIINAVLTLGYVLPLYLTKFTRLSFSKNPQNNVTRSKDPSKRWRDDPAVIKARLLSVSASTIASVYLMHYISVAVQSDPLKTGWDTTAVHLGFSLCKSNLPAHFVTPALFLGPLYARYLGQWHPFMTNWSKRDLLNWVGIRNYVAGPISEELVWRSCIICAYRLAGASNKFLIFFTPLTFGSAHLHHAWETYNMHGRTTQALRRAIFSALFQFTYTTLFGFHSAFLFLRTSSLIPAITSHVFCNIMGFPTLQYELRWYPHRRRQIILAYCAGVVLYIYGMRAWTSQQDSPFWFHGASNLQ